MQWFKKLQVCCQQGKIRIWDSALTGAADDFGIYGAKQLRQVIGEDGLDEVEFIHVAPCDFDPRLTARDYKFAYGRKRGYLALFEDLQSRMVLKSFKRDIAREEMENTPFKSLLAGLPELPKKKD
jgi:hypothetical protein